LLGSTTINGPDLRVDREGPIVVGSPLRGSGWVSLNGCCADATLSHRADVLAANGAFVTSELFAIDWTRLADGGIHTGDGTQNSDYPAYGAPVYSATDGTVVSAVNSMSDVPPSTPNPEVKKTADFAGNSAIIRIVPGRYAAYAHMQRGSVRVRRWQRVRAGQRLGTVGNSGQSFAPHLHFLIQADPNYLASQSLPFELDRYTLEGTAEAGPDGQITVVGQPRTERRSYPLVNSAMTLAPRTGADGR
jgi:murein DD-endopeptidase MepM/ murein hydrolase activator NlpD